MNIGLLEAVSLEMADLSLKNRNMRKMLLGIKMTKSHTRTLWKKDRKKYKPYGYKHDGQSQNLQINNERISTNLLQSSQNGLQKYILMQVTSNTHTKHADLEECNVPLILFTQSKHQTRTIRTQATH